MNFTTSAVYPLTILLKIKSFKYSRNFGYGILINSKKVVIPSKSGSVDHLEFNM